MITRFFIGTKHKAAAFKVKVITNGFRYDEMCDIISSNIIKDMNNCFKSAREEVGYSDKRMSGAEEMISECPEIVDLECVKEKNGRITATVRWVSANNCSEKQTVMSHENGRKFSVAVCAYLNAHIKDAVDGISPKWLKRVDIKTIGFEQE